MSSGRKPRRKRRNPHYDSSQDVSSSWYVGYADDSESVEAIMKKFEEMEKLKEEVSQNEINSKKRKIDIVDEVKGKSTEHVKSESIYDNPEFTEKQFQELFRRTSGFTIQQINGDFDDFKVGSIDLWRMNDPTYGDEEEQEDEDYKIVNDGEFWDEEIGSIRNSSNDNMIKDLKSKKVNSKTVKKKSFSNENHKESNCKPTISSSINNSITHESIISKPYISQYQILPNTKDIIVQIKVQDKDGNHFMMKKRVIPLNSEMPIYVRIPNPPIPSTWVHQIKPYRYKSEKYGKTIKFDITTTNLKETLGNEWQAIILTPNLSLESNSKELDSISLFQLSQLKIDSILQPGGFIFLWSPKRLTPKLLRMATQSWGVRYAENIALILGTHGQNRIATQKDEYFCASKETCLVFCKPTNNRSRTLSSEGPAIDIRHQRSADCVFGFVVPDGRRRLCALASAGLHGPQGLLGPHALQSRLANRRVDVASDVVDVLLPNGRGRLLQLFAGDRCSRDGWTTVVHQSSV